MCCRKSSFNKVGAEEQLGKKIQRLDEKSAVASHCESEFMACRRAEKRVGVALSGRAAWIALHTTCWQNTPHTNWPQSCYFSTSLISFLQHSRKIPSSRIDFQNYLVSQRHWSLLYLDSMKLVMTGNQGLLPAPETDQQLTRYVNIQWRGLTTAQKYVSSSDRAHF